MKNLALLTLALVFAGAASAEGSSGAEEYNMHNRMTQPSSLTRAEVQAELTRAMAAGEIQIGEGGVNYVINQQADPPRDRTAVREEAIRAARNHPQDTA